MDPSTTPAAAPAVPVAAPVAPVAVVAPPAAVVAPVAPVAAPVAAPVVVATPAAAAPVVPATPAVASLLPEDAPVVPQTEAEKLAAAQELVKQAAAAADPNSGKAWLLKDGVMGEGEKPAWFKQDKYKTVAAQAEAYVHLEGRLGSFVGAPKDGAYKINVPAGVDVQTNSPLMTEFTKWAAKSQLSQEGLDQLMGFLVQDVASRAPNLEAIRGRLGENADARIAAVAQWGKANLGAEGYATLRAATSGGNADAVFKVLEQVIGKTGQVRLPKPGPDVPGGAPGAGLEAIKQAHFKRGPDGKPLVDTDPAYRRQIDKMYTDYYAGQAG
jgi:hypothetical protein